MIPPFVALFSFPLIAIILFGSLSQRPAIIWTLLLGYLFLPATIRLNLPLLPPLSKDTIPALSVFLCLMCFGAKARKAQEAPVLKGWLPGDKIMKTLFFASILGAFLTVLTNQDVQRFGPTVLPALRPYDSFSAILNTVFLLLPMFLARKYLGSEDSHRLLLKSLAIAGAIYSFPIIFELIMSPQLSNIVYGFFPHSWAQHIRSGGYRPLVFLKHGLWLGIFMCCAVLAALAYAREAKQETVKFLILGGWLLFILMLSNTLGAFAIALLLVPAILFLPSRVQLIGAAIVAGCVLIYPTLRGADLVPVNQAVDLAASIDAKRGSSLQHRLNNEDQLLERANLRPFFGWGGWSRSRIFNEQGQDVSTTDGQWIIQIGERGWLGYLAQFGLLCGPILIFALRPNKFKIGPATIGLCVVLAANLIDLVPNAGLTVITWLIGGALIGRLEHQGAEHPATSDAPVDSGKEKARYSRFDNKPSATRTPAHPVQTRSFGKQSKNAI